MAYEDARQKSAKPHSIIMEDRKRLSITGVEEVESFDDEEIMIHTGRGLMVIKGSSLQIDKLSTDSGEVTVQGLIDKISYEEVAPSGSLWTRLFH